MSDVSGSSTIAWGNSGSTERFARTLIGCRFVIFSPVTSPAPDRATQRMPSEGSASIGPFGPDSRSFATRARPVTSLYSMTDPASPKKRIPVVGSLTSAVGGESKGIGRRIERPEVTFRSSITGKDLSPVKMLPVEGDTARKSGREPSVGEVATTSAELTLTTDRFRAKLLQAKMSVSFTSATSSEGAGPTAMVVFETEYGKIADTKDSSFPVSLATTKVEPSEVATTPAPPSPTGTREVSTASSDALTIVM